MSDEKEVKLVVPKNLMVALWLFAGGLFANAVQVELIEQAWAGQLGETHMFPVHVRLVD